MPRRQRDRNRRNLHVWNPDELCACRKEEEECYQVGLLRSNYRSRGRHRERFYIIDRLAHLV